MRETRVGADRLHQNTEQLMISCTSKGLVEIKRGCDKFV